MKIIRPRRDPIESSANLASTIKSWRAGLTADEIQLGQMLIIEPLDRKDCIFEVGPANPDSRLLISRVNNCSATWIAAVDVGEPFDALSAAAGQRLGQFHELIRQHGRTGRDFRFLSAPAAEVLAIERGQPVLESSSLTLSEQIKALQLKAGIAAISTLSVREIVAQGHEEIRRGAFDQAGPDM